MVERVGEFVTSVGSNVVGLAGGAGWSCVINGYKAVRRISEAQLGAVYEVAETCEEKGRKKKKEEHHWRPNECCTLEVCVSSATVADIEVVFISDLMRFKDLCWRPEPKQMHSVI
jgi:hypothetical protein